MQADVSQDFEDYWNEYRILQETKLLDDYLEEVEDYGSHSCDEGEQEVEWLRAAGLPQLTTPYEQGLELPEIELDPALQLLPAHHAEAVRRRVRTLNVTVWKRGRQQRSRPRKPDIRDVFRDVENSSTGTRSRSATPDSLDSEHPGLEEVEPHSPPLPWCLPRGIHSYQQHRVTQDWAGQDASSIPNFIPSTDPGSHARLENEHLYSSYNKTPIQRLPIASNSTNEIFRRPGGWNGNHYRGDVATDSEGVQMLGYQRLGTIHLPRPRERARTGSDPLSPPYNVSAIKIPSSTVCNNNVVNLAKSSTKVLKEHRASNLSRSHSNLYMQDRDVNVVQQRAGARVVLHRSGSQGHIGFEELAQRPMIYDREKSANVQLKPKKSIYWDPKLIGRTWVEYLGEDDLSKLKSFLLLEATALFDEADISFRRRKAPRKKWKNDGNIFGVPLPMLLEKDRHVSAEDRQEVPLVFQKVLLHLERCGLREEGILRVGGLKQKVTVLCNELEAIFYNHPLEEVERLFQHATCHDVSGILKRLLRDLPQPLLSIEYIDMFYQTHALPDDDIRAHALNLLVLLLPPVHRSTLRALFRFLIQVIHNQKYNKMSQHNVAMIMAPSFFPPRYIHPQDKRDLQAQVEVASTSCQVTEQMLELGESLWIVPESLVRQIRRSNEEEHYRKGAKENNKPMMKLLGKRAGIREPITRKINNEVDFQDGVMRMSAPQFQLASFPIQLTENTTAGDIVLRIVDEAIKKYEIPTNDLMRGSRRPFHDKCRALAELAPYGNLSCILATGTSELALQSHFLYEVGGNIGQRQIEHGAILLAVYKENPNAQWILRCHHRNANNAPL